MRKSICTIVFICAFISITAQDSQTKAAKSYANYHYIDAAKKYERKVRKGDDSQETLQKLGNAYYSNADMGNAVKWYGQLFSKYERTLSPEYIFKYIHSLKGVGNYELAKALMKIYANKFDETTYKVEQFNDNDLALDKIRNQQPQFVVTPLSFNSKFADFAPMFYQDKIVFASSRDTSKLQSRVYEWNKQPYLNLYEADTVQLGTDLVDVRPFSKNINTKYHEAVTTFDPAGAVMYFTRNNYTDKNLKRDSQGINRLKMYRSELEEEIWTMPKEVPFNSLDYSVGQPALSPDGKRLYFVSDMPGGEGGTDIYFVNLLEDGSYSEPINIGSKVNTKGREMFPFVTNEKLYFASDGHLGLGGLDVFEVQIADSLGTAVNLGPVINTGSDDFAFIINENTNRGYFSSNRDGGRGDDDIYSFQRLQPNCEQSVKGTVLRKANEQAVVNAEVSLKAKDGSTIAIQTTDAYGVFTFDVPLECQMQYQILVSKDGYESNEVAFSTTEELDKTHQVPLIITKKLNKLIVTEDGVMKIKIDDIYFNVNKDDIRPDAAEELNKVVEVMKEYPKMVIKIESHTDSRGSDKYNESLSDRRAKSTAAYISSQGIEANRIESAIGYGEKQLLNRCANGVKCTKDEHDINRRSEFIIVRL